MEILKAIIAVSKLDCHVTFAMDTNILIIEMVMYRNVVLPSITITTIDIILKSGSFFKKAG